MKKDSKRKLNSSLGKLIRFEHYLLLIFYIFFIIQRKEWKVNLMMTKRMLIVMGRKMSKESRIKEWNEMDE